MKLTLVFALYVIALVGSQTWAHSILSPFENEKDEHAFVRTMKRLHKEPMSSKVSSKSNSPVRIGWIEQKLDHFDPTETRTWQMRYMWNDEHFQAGGPIFIEVGGEWEIGPWSLESGDFYNLARQHNGMMFYTEHRYYGESRPTSDISTENLKYLDVKQALADLNHFIEVQRATNPAMANSRIIMQGCSYAGTMVTWFERLYPGVMTGGFASGAPLKAKVDFKEYTEVMGKTMQVMGSQQCYDRIKNGIAGLEEKMLNGRSAEVMAMLRICNNFNPNNEFDVWTLFSSISNIFAWLVQYQSGNDVEVYCDFIMSLSDDDVDAMAKFILWGFGYPSCVNVAYSGMVSFYTDTSFDGGWARPWYYQTCNEYGWYQSSSSANQPFGTQFPPNLYTQVCHDAFSTVFTKPQIGLNVDHSNNVFGGFYPEVENVYTTHGGLDPWHPMGLSEENGAVIIPNASHCADFGWSLPSDPPEMQASKQRFAELVAKWLA